METNRIKHKNREVLKRHNKYFKFLKFMMRFYFKKHYQLKAREITKLRKGGPYLMLMNHLVAPDPLAMLFMVNKPVYFVGTELLYNLGLPSKIISHGVNIIAKSKSVSDSGTIKKILRIAKEGGNIGITPEGNITYDGNTSNINESIGKLAKVINLDILIFNNSGMYLANPRWATQKRKGPSNIKLVKTITKEELKSLSSDETYQIIKKHLQHNELKHDEKRVKYIGNKRAEGLERLIFFCPRCSYIAMYSKDNNLKCRHCNYTYYYDEYGFVKNEDHIYTHAELERFVISKYVKWLNFQGGDFLIKDFGFALENLPKKRKKLGKCAILMSENGINVSFKNNQVFYTYQDLIGIAIQGKNKILIYPKSGMKLIIKFDDYVSPYKYLITYQFYVNNRTDDLSKYGLF